MVKHRTSRPQYVLADSQKIGSSIPKTQNGYSVYHPLSEDAYNELHYNRARRGEYSQPGDVYGPPRFFRYGEGGRNKKKSNNRGFTQKDEGGIVDEQFKQRYKQ